MNTEKYLDQALLHKYGFTVDGVVVVKEQLAKAAETGRTYEPIPTTT